LLFVCFSFLCAEEGATNVLAVVDPSPPIAFSCHLLAEALLSVGMGAKLVKSSHQYIQPQCLENGLLLS
jgi:hypothetical protein